MFRYPWPLIWLLLLLTLVPVIIYVCTITRAHPPNSKVMIIKLSMDHLLLSFPAFLSKVLFLSNRILTFGGVKLPSWNWCNHMTCSFQILTFQLQGLLVSYFPCCSLLICRVWYRSEVNSCFNGGILSLGHIKKKKNIKPFILLVSCKWLQVPEFMTLNFCSCIFVIYKEENWSKVLLLALPSNSLYHRISIMRCDHVIIEFSGWSHWTQCRRSGNNLFISHNQLICCLGFFTC